MLAVDQHTPNLSTPGAVAPTRKVRRSADATRMSWSVPKSAERLHFDAQVSFARPIAVLLAIFWLMELRLLREMRLPLTFLIAYLLLAVATLWLEEALRARNWRPPLWCDIFAVAIALYLSPVILPIWFLLFFVAYTAGYRWNFRLSLTVSAALSIFAVALLLQRAGPADLAYLGSLLSLLAILPGAAGMAFLGDRNRRFVAQQDFLARLADTMHVDLGLAESLRLMLEELCGEFKTEEALLVYRDSDLERVFLWRVHAGLTQRLTPENLPMMRSDDFLLDDVNASVCWNSLDGRGSGFGRDRRDGSALKMLPRIAGPTQQEFGIRNLLTVTFDQDGQPAGRLFLINRKASSASFSMQDLTSLERIARQISASLENLFLLRHLRARAIEAERSRISRDLHDGILQTLLSIEIQLDVLRRKVALQPDHAEAALASLQQTVKNEGGELRHMVTDLRPLRVQSADLVDLMRGFGERFRNESGLALDVLVDSAELHAPDRVCREIFQIYREALNNIKKHAKASHVVVKLSQDDSRLVLVVDDNGEGFSFAGRFTGDELDRLRLGPISIKERTRTVGGVLTVESNPGHGARLKIEVPLG